MWATQRKNKGNRKGGRARSASAFATARTSSNSVAARADAQRDVRARRDLLLVDKGAVRGAEIVEEDLARLRVLQDAVLTRHGRMGAHDVRCRLVPPKGVLRFCRHFDGLQDGAVLDDLKR